MFPHLYPTADFTDTGILQHYQDVHSDNTNRVASIGLSWTRKVLSTVRAYGEQRDLSFFLYEKHLANKFFHAQVRAKSLGVTADVLTRDSQTSAGYWDIVQDSLADVVRIMLTRCFDEQGHPELHRQCRGLRGEFWLCAFPNLFLTIAPAEWTFPNLDHSHIINIYKWEELVGREPLDTGRTECHQCLQHDGVCPNQNNEHI